MQKKIVKVRHTKQVSGNKENLDEQYIEREGPYLDEDELQESDGFYYEEITENKELLRHILQSGALHYLSNQQYRVFQYMFRQGFNMTDTGKLLRIKRQTVLNYVQEIGNKLREMINFEIAYQNRGVN